MANLFDNLDLDESLEIQEQRIAGPSAFIKDSGIYTAQITMARLIESTGGANAAVLTFETEEGQKLTRTVWFTNKKGQTYWEKNDRKGNLPGYEELCRLSELLTDSIHSFGSTEDKVVDVWSYEKKEEVPTESKVIMSFIGKPVKLLIRKTLEDATELDASTGKYEPNGKTKTVTEVEGYVNPINDKTSAEKKANRDAVSLEKFKALLEKTPVNDKRKVATGDASEEKKESKPSEAAKDAFA